jgi:acetyl esterase/lipase
MEALFSYIQFEELQDPGTKPKLTIDTKPEEVYQPVIRLVKSAQSLAMLRRKKSEAQPRRRKRDIIWNSLKLVAHNVGYIAGGVKELVTQGTARPTWNYGTHVGLAWLRNTILFENNTLEAVRSGEATAGSLLKTLVKNECRIKEVKWGYNRKYVMDYERDGQAYTQSTQAWRYPIPQEDSVHFSDSDIVQMDGEWILPLHDHLKSNGKTSSSGLLNKFFGKYKRQQKKVILYLHGGCYILGSPQVYRNLTSLLARTNDCPVFALNYRLAPEHPFPAGLHDAFAAYIWLMNPKHPMFEYQSGSGDSLNQAVFHDGYLPEEIVICGDSAGGGLTMALLNYLNMYLRNDIGNLIVPLPRCAVLLSPWVDLTCSSKSWEDNKGLDFLPAEATDLHQPVIQFVQHPVYSYCFGEYSGRHLEVLSPKGTTVPYRIPSIVGVSQMNDKEPNPYRKMDQEWMEQNLKEAERDALERFVRHPLVSPVFGDLRGLCPILIVFPFDIASWRM